jgi:hypothetical protein
LRVNREKKVKEKKRKMSQIKIHKDLPQGRASTERRNTLCIKKQTTIFSLFFLLSVEALLEADPNEFSML